MAQRTKKEEAEFKVLPETLTPCVNNCGVIGNPATNNMCQKCFKATTVSTAVKFSQGSPRSSSARSLERTSDPAETSKDLRKEDPKVKDEARRQVNRCSGCRRKVGLTGFRCRCGEIFCAEHRYSDRHDCSFDYKAAARDRIARENPVVKAAKIVKL